MNAIKLVFLTNPLRYTPVYRFESYCQFKFFAMKFLFLILFSIILMTSCDDDVDCIIDEDLNKKLFIELTDINANNLVENGTFRGENIIIRSTDIEFNFVNNDNPKFENLLCIKPTGPEGKLTYDIQLSETKTDNLTVNLTNLAPDSPCSYKPFSIDSVNYNDKEQTLQEFDQHLLITVVLP